MVGSKGYERSCLQYVYLQLWHGDKYLSSIILAEEVCVCVWMERSKIQIEWWNECIEVQNLENRLWKHKLYK